MNAATTGLPSSEGICPLICMLFDATQRMLLQLVQSFLLLFYCPPLDLISHHH